MNDWLRRLLRRPKLSVIVVVYDMAREAPRTLHSLALPYQMGITADDYEVLVMDNGSPQPLGPDLVRGFGSQFKYHYIRNAAKSPAAAINLGASLSRGEFLGIYIDGARIASPGLLSTANLAFGLYKDPVVATLGWHLGPDVQQKSVLSGYDKKTEDALIDSIGWPRDGYRLFEISTLAPSSNRGYFAAPSESNALFMRRSSFTEMHGFDVAFDEPGGGLVNLDFFIRALEREQSPLVMLLGEGSFHQIHGGASTGAEKPSENRFQTWADKYRRLRGKDWRHPQKPATYLGDIHPAALGSLRVSLEIRRDTATGGSAK